MSSCFRFVWRGSRDKNGRDDGFVFDSERLLYGKAGDAVVSNDTGAL